jgi:hypothetical protein
LGSCPCSAPPEGRGQPTGGREPAGRAAHCHSSQASQSPPPRPPWQPVSWGLLVTGDEAPPWPTVGAGRVVGREAEELASERESGLCFDINPTFCSPPPPNSNLPWPHRRDTFAPAFSPSSSCPFLIPSQAALRSTRPATTASLCSGMGRTELDALPSAMPAATRAR